MKARKGAGDRAKFANGIGGVMKKKDVKVGVIGQQVEDVVTLAPNGNIKERM
jgi:hypothetical protein